LHEFLAQRLGENVRESDISPLATHLQSSRRPHSRRERIVNNSTTTGLNPGFFWLILVLTVVAIAGLWRTYQKAGQPGWAAIIPIYNVIVLLRIAQRPLWWLILLLIPLVNIVVGIVVAIDVAKAFGKSGGFAVGLILLSPIFYCILGFGSARYQGRPATSL
jgi:hypothetical protein